MSKASRSLSGAIGGPSTGHGIKYQIEFAVRQALDLMSRALSVPVKNWAICVEPRALSTEGSTEWDLAIEPDEKFIESKLSPKRTEILDFLDRLRKGAASSPQRRFCLVYSKGRGSILGSLGQLIRIAIETKGDIQKFQRLVDLEKIADADEIFARLGEEPHDLLQRIELMHAPKDLLAEENQLRARLLAGEEAGKHILDLFFCKFSEAGTKRLTIFMNDLITEVHSEGIKLQPPPEVDPRDLPRPAASALVILQVCEIGIPLGVVAMGVGCALSDLERDLAPLLTENVLTVKDNLWSLRPLPNRLTVPGAEDLIARTLESLLRFIEDHKYQPIGRSQITNAVTLAKACSVSRPRPVSNVFATLDKLLKRSGDKHLVLEVANLSIGAARRCSPRDRQEVEAEGRALICGVSWVYQRVGRLDEARTSALKSRELAEMINSDVNVAFCIKCLGRLRRMEAESSPDGNERESKLHESTSLLQEAIDRFSRLGPFGPTHPEVGDCYSLLGRTYLVTRQLANADLAIQKAYQLITDSSSKDYLDLMILDGDLQAARGNRDDAESLYSNALKLPSIDDPEKSEIRARAYFSRGLNRKAMGHKDAAIRDLEDAAKLWRDLGEHATAATAEWEELLLSEQFSPAELQLLDRERHHTVRVEAVKLHKVRLSSHTRRRVPQREKPGLEYWKQLIQEAKVRVAVEVIEW